MPLVGIFTQYAVRMDNRDIEMERENEIRSMREHMEKLQIELWRTEQAYKEKLRILQQSCSHEFIKEPDNDFHRPGLYYTCKRCDFLTRYK